jgi:folate-binding protein YgfZ
MNAAQTASAVRRGAGLFRDVPRAVLSVTGSDRVRWLNGMISNDVAILAPGPSGSGCYAVLLTAQGRIVSDLQVLARSDAFWIDLEASACAAVVERLTKYIIADDVEITELSAEFDRFALEGPAAREIFARAVPGAPLLAPDAWAEVEVAGGPVTVAAFGWSGEAALQFFAVAGTGGAVAEVLRGAGEGSGLVDASATTHEILRIEAGVPRTGFELDESVLPAEAGLARAIATTKGCYTGQEVVERLRSQGKASHLLVGLESTEGVTFEIGAAVEVDDKRVGEVTSACVSAAVGPIALAFLRRAVAEPGTAVRVAGRGARVARLPFAASGSKARRGDAATSGQDDGAAG